MKNVVKQMKGFSIQKMAIIFGLFAMIIFFSFASSNFFTPSNINTTLQLLS